MRTLAAIVIALVALVGGAVAYWMINSPTYTYRYRLAIELDVDGEVRSGSTVVEVKWQLWPPALAGLFGGGIGQSRVFGQALFIDLGSHGALLAALRRVPVPERQRSVGMDFLAIRAFSPGPLPPSGYPLSRELLRDMSKFRGKAALGPNNLPQFIWLRDINDPGSARALIAEQFPSMIGDTVRLRAARIETTADPISSDLEQKLPWLAAMHQEQVKTGVLGRSGQFVLITSYLVGGV